MKKRILESRIVLVLLGIGFGLLARMVLGVPETEDIPTRTIERPLLAPAEAPVDIPLIDRKKNKNDVRRIKRKNGDQDSESQNEADEEISGLVPPVFIGGSNPNFAVAKVAERGNKTSSDDFAHDLNAIFEPHGEKVCASGCAASRHPTEELTRDDYFRLLQEVEIEPMDRTNNALEALMYFGPQTRKFMESEGVGSLDSDRAKFIWNELDCTHAKIAIRVTDENGVIRTWLDPTRVPLDRRHVFEMKTKDLQALVTSGTVKRVGLDHIWVRL